jgi:Lon protease-like protein
MSELPLFPLQTILLPDGRLALRIFEARYLDMVARCLRGTNRFGVVAIREGAEVGGAATTYDHGTSAEIVDWHQEPGGLLGILAAGREPFRLLGIRRQPDGLYVGNVSWLPLPPPIALSPAHEPLAALLRRLIEPLPLYQGVTRSFEDAAWVGGRLIELLPLELARKQALLEMPDPGGRLDTLAAALDAAAGESGT